MARRLLIAALVLLVAFGLVIAAHSRPVGPHVASTLLAVTISFFSILGGYVANRWAFGRPAKQFMATLVGGMLARLMVIALLLIWVVKTLEIPLLTFFVCLSISYLVFQAVEVWTIHQDLKQGKL